MTQHKDPCPTCGRPFPGQTKYSSPEERSAGIKSAWAKRREVKLALDYAVLKTIAEPFNSGDIGHALRRAGRFWSENSAVIQRGLQFGTLVQVEGEHYKTRLIRRFKRGPWQPSAATPVK